MRAWLAIVGMLLVSPAIAAPLRLSPTPHDLLIPHWNVPRYTPDISAQYLPSYARLDRRGDEVIAPVGLSFGPVHAESETVNGHRRVHYRVEGLSLFGGDIGGSVGHGGAMLTLHWASPAN